MSRLARVVVEVSPLHLDHPFDYRLDADVEVAVGQRVLVPFAGRRVRGLVVDLPNESDVPTDRLRSVARVLGPHVWVNEDELALLRWAADRFAAPLADVLRHALPDRTVDVERRAAEAGWFPPGSDARPSGGPPPEPGALAAAWAPYGTDGHRLLDAVASGGGSFLWRPLPGEDLAGRIAELTQLTLAHGRDVLVLVPDPASPTADAVVTAAADLAVDLRGGPSPRVTYRRWLEARCGQARVVVGERGAAFVPLDRLGLAVIVDEANPAYKERRSPRSHAREIVLERARRAGGVGLAVGTVPSAVAWRLLRQRRLTPVVAVREAERRARESGAEHHARPRVEVIDGAGQPRARLTREASAALRTAVRSGRYGVLLATRRGEGGALVCRACGDRVRCPTCEASLAAAEDGGVVCPVCGHHGPRRACRSCRNRELVPLAAGAQRFGAELARSMEVPVAVLEGYARTPPPPPAVLVTTRGSVLDRPPGPVGAVVLPDLDALLRRPSLDAAEDALRLAFQVAGWCVHGGGDPAASRVVVQTREVDHHAIRALAAWDPGGFWRAEVALRAPLGFPPLTTAIRLSVARGAVLDGTPLEEPITHRLPSADTLLGPLPEEGRDGYLVTTTDPAGTLASLRELRERCSREGVELRVDVDPVGA
ncbi:MAG: hypothetical protein ACLFS9_10255, partial [Nitriliruptoraceae bacterium]